MKQVELIMPKLGLTMTMGVISKVNCKEGDFVREGDTVMEFETEKLTEPITAPFDGYVVKLLAAQEDEIDCGKPVCIFADQI